MELNMQTYPEWEDADTARAAGDAEGSPGEAAGSESRDLERRAHDAMRGGV